MPQHTRRTVVAGLVLPAALAATGPAQAQGWLEKGLSILKGATGNSGRTGALSLTDATAGLREALTVATGRTVDRVGRSGGYLNDAAIHIPLPNTLKTAQRLMGAVGGSGLLDDLEIRLNRSAERAAPEARSIFFGAIERMTIEDAFTILDGPDDAATRYFERQMTPPLKSAFRPIINDELEDAGAFNALERFVGGTQARALAPAASQYARSDLADHGLGYALGGLFHYLAKEEAEIRNNPVKRTTDLLKRVFG